MLSGSSGPSVASFALFDARWQQAPFGAQSPADGSFVSTGAHASLTVPVLMQVLPAPPPAAPPPPLPPAGVPVPPVPPIGAGGVSSPPHAKVKTQSSVAESCVQDRLLVVMSPYLPS